MIILSNQDMKSHGNPNIYTEQSSAENESGDGPKE